MANEQLLLTKEFIDDPAVPGGAVTLEFAISTLGISDAAADLAFTDDLSAALGLKVSINHELGGTSGSLVLKYKSLEQLDDICRKLSAPSESSFD